jgi:thymidylate synthase (FAD)
MQDVKPEVFLVGETGTRYDGLDDYLSSIGAPDWENDAPTEAEELLEVAGRGCYRSFAPGLNLNVTKVREGNAPYLANIADQRHGSVFEHASASFIFQNVSRVFTHELVRHRVGVGISQESLRYVRLDEIKFWMPSVFADDPVAAAIVREAVEVSEAYQQRLAAHFGLDDPKMSFARKKQITSAMRRIAPEGLGTMIMWTANFRTLRHVIETRTDPAAEEEIRLVFGKVGEIAVHRWPNAFGDYEVEIVDGLPHYRTENRKI